MTWKTHLNTHLDTHLNKALNECIPEQTPEHPLVHSPEPELENSQNKHLNTVFSLNTETVSVSELKTHLKKIPEQTLDHSSGHSLEDLPEQTFEHLPEH